MYDVSLVLCRKDVENNFTEEKFSHKFTGVIKFEVASDKVQIKTNNEYIAYPLGWVSSYEYDFIDSVKLQPSNLV